MASYLERWHICPQFLARSGRPYPLLTQASECEDQPHRQKGQNGASQGPWHEVSG